MKSFEVKNLSIEYVTEKGEPLIAVKDLSFSIPQGKSLGLVGESGCGKTTVMLSLMRLLPEAGRITSGQVLLNGLDLFQISEKEVQKIRWKEIAMVFQGAMNALNPVRTVESQIVEALMTHEILSSQSDARKRAGELLELVGIASKRGKQYPFQFSGGMRQRAVIAMALSCSPKVLIADEPTTALDVMVQAQITDLLRRLQKEMNLTLVLVTHDLGVVAEICDDVLVMYGGVMAEYADSDTLFNQAGHPYTQRLLQAFPDIANPLSKLASIPGVPPRLNALPPGCRFEPRCDVRIAGLCEKLPPPIIQISAGHTAGCHLLSRGDHND